MKTGGKIHLLSGNDKDFSTRYAAIAAALEPLPNETVIDGEVVAMDTSGRPSFKALQNFSAGVPVFYYVFDVLILSGRDVMRDPWRPGANCSGSISCRNWTSRSDTRRISTWALRI